ncbi:Gfo/Idh/MocA family oxidoreductase [soil metagenome]
MTLPLRFAVLGAGFWSRFQLAAWQELEGARCVAICDPDRSKAEARAREFGVPAVYDDPAAMFDNERLDFVDIISSPESHGPLVHLAAERKVAVICQKPMAPNFEESKAMVAACQEAGVTFLIHENWRWQTPIQHLRQVLGSMRIGNPFRARIDFRSSFDVFANQPFLKELDRFILTDIGTHILDVARFLFGEAEGLFCTTSKVRRDIKGEDVATVLLVMKSGATVVCNMAYAGTPLEHDRFPETYVFVEGDDGSAELGPDYWVRQTTAEGTFAKRVPPPRFPWADPAYDVVHASILACNAAHLGALRGELPGTTTGEDNLKTLRLVEESYRSAAERRFIPIS